ncbi:MAG TPA: hypothetical protein PKD55_05785 [Bellilinea sp.]|nr:hypothetical protein [Bellilinea sp.]
MNQVLKIVFSDDTSPADVDRLHDAILAIINDYDPGAVILVEEEDFSEAGDGEG